jgi:flavin reductase (DIM6/NTAB) family NADH-FMN oxidoreductase RutF
MPVKTPADGSVPTSHLERDGFRAAMRELAGGVSAISCRHSGQLAGFTATSVSSLSVDPPSLVVCVNRSSSSWPTIAVAKCFGVNILSSTHHELAHRFSGAGGAEGAQRFEEAKWISLRTGAPLLEDALASFDCAVEEIIERYSHAIVIGRVEAVRRHGGGGALVYWRGAYDQLGWSSEEISTP